VWARMLRSEDDRKHFGGSCGTAQGYATATTPQSGRPSTVSSLQSSEQGAFGPSEREFIGPCSKDNEQPFMTTVSSLTVSCRVDPHICLSMHSHYVASLENNFRIGYEGSVPSAF
jgi:hypothetical protein